MIVPTVVCKGFEEVAYFHIDEETGHGFLVDPGAEAERLIATVRKNQWTILMALTAFCHPSTRWGSSMKMYVVASFATLCLTYV